MTDWLPRLVARAPATVHAKLLVAFLAIVVLLIAVCRTPSSSLPRAAASL